MTDSVNQAVAFIRDQSAAAPQAVIVLGSGMGKLATRVEAPAVIPYASLPGFAQTSAIGHAGNLILGQLEGVQVAMLQGRFHLYEGHSEAAIRFPIVVLRELGADTYLATNASGGVNPQLSQGDVLVVRDHVDMMFRQRATQPSGSPRATSALWPYYDESLIDAALDGARQNGVPAQSGVYVGLLGPNYETRSEYRMVRKMGGDVVGMSTVPEIIMARAQGMRCLALSIVTNIANPDALTETTGEAVVHSADEVEPRMSAVIRHVLRSLRRP